MDWCYLTLGICLSIIGVIILILYDKEFKPRRIGGLSYRMRTGGIGAIIIGIYFIVLAFKNT